MHFNDANVLERTLLHSNSAFCLEEAAMFTGPKWDDPGHYFRAQLFQSSLSGKVIMAVPCNGTDRQYKDLTTRRTISAIGQL